MIFLYLFIFSSPSLFLCFWKLFLFWVFKFWWKWFSIEIFSFLWFHIPFFKTFLFSLITIIFEWFLIFTLAAYTGNELFQKTLKMSAQFLRLLMKSKWYSVCIFFYRILFCFELRRSRGSQNFIQQIFICFVNLYFTYLTILIFLFFQNFILFLFPAYTQNAPLEKISL